MADSSIFRKLIIVESDTTSLKKLNIDLDKAQAMLNGFGAVTEKATGITQKSVPVMDKFGKITNQTMATINTESGKAYNVMIQGSKQATSSMGDFERALRRVAIVAPTWMIFRAIMQSVIQGFSEGFKYMEEFDKAILKAQAVIHGSGKDMGETVEDLKGRIRALSQETGESMTQIASAFYRFGTVGAQFEEAWRGAEASVKYAMTTMGTADQIAKTMALVFRLMGDRVDQTIPPMERQEVQMAKMYKLWQVNAFEADELNNSFKAFLPTANSMNLSLDQTTALLATVNSAALQSSRGGTLLRTSFSKLLENTDKLAGSLGMYVNPQLSNTFELFVQVIGKIKELGEGVGIPIAAQKAISDIFGGVRGGEPVRAIASLYELLNENLDVTTKTYDKLGEVIKNYKKREEEVLATKSQQLKIMRELRIQVFETFINGITGADEYGESLKKINELSKQLIPVSAAIGKMLSGRRPIGTAIREMFTPPKAGMEAEDIQKLEESKITSAENEEYQSRQFKLLYAGVEKLKEQRIINGNIVKELKYQETESSSILEILKMQNAGYDESVIATAKIAQEVNLMVDKYNDLDDVLAGTEPKLSKQQIFTDVMKGNWEKILEITKGNIFGEDELLKLAKQLTDVERTKLNVLNEQQQTMNKMYISYEKATSGDRSKLRRVMELQVMSPEEQIRQFQTNMYDKNLMMDFVGSLSEQVQKAMAEEIRKNRNLPQISEPYIGTGKATSLLTKTQQDNKAMTLPPAKVDFNTQIGNININLPEDSLDKLAEATAEKVKEELINNEELQKNLAKILRKII